MDVRAFWRRLGTLVRLPADERRVLLSSVVLLAVARSWLRVRGLPAARRAARRLASRHLLPPDRIQGLVTRAAGVLPGETMCLPRAIALEALLARAGHRAQLRIGVVLRREEASRPLEAHAWVEVDGVAVGEDVSRWARLDELASPLPG